MVRRLCIDLREKNNSQKLKMLFLFYIFTVIGMAYKVNLKIARD